MFNLARRAILGAVLGWIAAAIVVPAYAQGVGRVAVDSDKVAIKGYDPVGYFTDRRPVKGTSEFEHVWNDARWQFSSAANRDMFAADPERFAPQFGGFCAWGLSQGMVMEADPEQWTVVDGKLYMKMDHAAREEWRSNPGDAIAKAQSEWARRQSGN